MSVDAKMRMVLSGYPELEAEYDRLLQSDDILQKAYEAGVDNWSGWGSWVTEEDEGC